MPPSIAREITGSEDGFCDASFEVRSEPATGPLQLRDSGERVRALQAALIAKGLLEGTADGEFGMTTQAAVFDFQFLEFLVPDGLAGPATHDALGIPFR